MQSQRGRLAAEVIENVRAATDIVELIGQFVNLKRAGSSFKGLCPFHGEKTPSFFVRPDKQMYYCFGCQRGGDPFRFVMEHDGVSFTEAVRLLGQRAGITVEVGSESEGQDALYAVAEAAAGFFAATLRGPQGERARTYLQQRGLSRQSADRFRLGAAPAAWDGLGQALRAEGFGEDKLLQLGLVTRRRQGDGVFDTLRDRLVFPIHSLSGRVVGFGGRLLPGPEAGDAPKYLNSPDSPIYHKGKVLYGLAEARAAIRRADSAIITEGYMDFLSLFQAGIEHVVAACGTAFGAAQAALLHRYTHRAYILGDSDPAGRRAAVRAAGLLLEHGFLVHIVELPSGYDPDSFVREHGAAAMATRVREAPGYVTYMKLLVDRRAGELAVKERVARHLLADLGRVSDPLLQELYSKELSRTFGLSESTVSAALEKGKKRAGGALIATPEPPEAPADATTAAVQEARQGSLRLALSSREWAARLLAALEPADFGAGPEGRLCAALQAAGADGVWREQLTSSTDEALGTRLEFEGAPRGEPEQLFRDYRATLLEARLEKTGLELRRRLVEAEKSGDHETTARLLAEQQALARDRRELRRPPSVS